MQYYFDIHICTYINEKFHILIFHIIHTKFSSKFKYMNVGIMCIKGLKSVYTEKHTQITG